MQTAVLTLLRRTPMTFWPEITRILSLPVIAEVVISLGLARLLAEPLFLFRLLRMEEELLPEVVSLRYRLEPRSTYIGARTHPISVCVVHQRLCWSLLVLRS